MKKIFSILFLTTIVFACAALLPTQAQAATEGHLTYVIGDGQAIIVGCDPSASGEFIIPSTLGGYPVTRIDSRAFNGCSKLKKIDIPDGVTSIGNSAFETCNFTEITLPNSLVSIGTNAFYECRSLTSITLPASVTSLGEGVFHYCSSLKEVTILGELTSIPEQAFCGTSLTNISIPDTVLWIEREAFADCDFTSIVLPERLRRVGDYAFYSCSKLKKIDIPDGVTSIGHSAFKWCNSLITVTLGNSVNIIDNYAFDGCSSLTNITIPSGIKRVANSAFRDCMNLSDVYYGGSQKQWNDINIGDDNTMFQYANVHFALNCDNSHHWDDGEVTKKATCKEEGVTTYTCTACGETKTESIAKSTTHSWDSGKVTKAATCKEAGVKTYTCSVCKATKTETIAKLTTHTYDHACDTDCNVCGITRTTTHQYKTVWSKDKTNHWHECSVCKDKKDVVAHTPGAEATETTAQTCTTCGYVIKAALNHIHNFASTWTTDANGHWYACDGCEEKGSYATHTPGTEATPTTDQTCTVCGHVMKEATGETEPTPQPTGPSGTEVTQPESIPATPTEPTTTPIAPTEPVGGNEPSTDPTVWIIVAVVVVVLGGGITGIIIWKKKH